MKNNNLSAIILGGGCFWCIESVFKNIKGIRELISGYAGGRTPDPNYESVATGVIGHAEVVYLKFDPQEISLEKILEIFFTVHNPTTLNRQGNDVGTEYRSLILYTTDDQKKIIENYISNLQKDYKEPIVTEVKKLEHFYRAEEYHQNYFEKNPHSGYCQLVIQPKLKKAKEKFKLEML